MQMRLSVEELEKQTTVSSLPDDGVQESCLIHTCMDALQFLNGLVEVNDAIQQAEDLAAKLRHIQHCPVVCIEQCQKDVHPARMDEGPCHELKEVNLECLGADLVNVLSQNCEGSCNPEDNKRLEGEDAEDDAT